jgi:hypothetical protein
MAALIPNGPLTEIGLHYKVRALKQVKIPSAFEMISPRYDLPQKIEDVAKKEAGRESSAQPSRANTASNSMTKIWLLLLFFL